MKLFYTYLYTGTQRGRLNEGRNVMEPIKLTWKQYDKLKHCNVCVGIRQIPFLKYFPYEIVENSEVGK